MSAHMDHVTPIAETRTSKLVFHVDEPQAPDTFIEVRAYCAPATERRGYSAVYRKWHDGLWYPNGVVHGNVSRTWADLVAPAGDVTEVFITVLAVPPSERSAA